MSLMTVRYVDDDVDGVVDNFGVDEFDGVDFHDDDTDCANICIRARAHFARHGRRLT